MSRYENGNDTPRERSATVSNCPAYPVDAKHVIVRIPADKIPNVVRSEKFAVMVVNETDEAPAKVHLVTLDDDDDDVLEGITMSLQGGGEPRSAHSARGLRLSTGDPLMRFTIEQYQKAIDQLVAARGQLVPDCRNCTVCGDSGHQAFECGHNPLVAMQMCEITAKRADELHDALHEMEGRFPTVADAFSGAGAKSPSSIAIKMVEVMADDANELYTTIHEFIHSLAGFNVHLGMQVGPARVVLPGVDVQKVERPGDSETDPA